MDIEINGIIHNAQFTFNSFKYMENFNLADLKTIEDTPFKVVPFLENLLMGALNSNPRTRVALADVDDYLDNLIESGGSLSDLMDELLNLLEESNFFKSLQKKPTAKAKK